MLFGRRRPSRSRREAAPVPQEGVSRRGLFTLGLDRVIPDDDEEPAEPGPVAPPAAEPVDVDEDAHARLVAAREAGEGELWRAAAHQLVSASLVIPGEHVADVLGADGTLGIIAAERLARVTSLDDSVGLQAVARRRADEAEQDGISWVSLAGPVLPYADGHFDTALSAFGVTNSLHAVRLIDEMARVTRLEGVIGLTAWAEGGIAGRLLALAQERVPLPEEVTPPLDWTEERLVAVLGSHVGEVEVERHTLELSFASRAEAVQALLRGLAPVGAAHARVPLNMELAAAVDALAEPGQDAMTITADYLLVTGERS